MAIEEGRTKNIRDEILKLNARKTFLKNEEMNSKNKFDELRGLEL